MLTSTRLRGLTAMALAVTMSVPAVADAEPSVIKVVRLVVQQDDGTKSLISGSVIVRSMKGEAQPSRIVSDQGDIDDPITCAPGDRLEARPKAAIYTRNSGTRPCQNPAEFQFQRQGLVPLYPVRATASSGGAGYSEYLQAYSDMAIAYDQAAKSSSGAEKLEYEKRASASYQAVVAATAHTLAGGGGWESLVQFDRTQGNKLVLTRAGVDALKKFQQDAGLPANGQLDFKTIGAIGKRDVPDSVKTQSGEYLALPTEWTTDKVVKLAPTSSSLKAVAADARKQNASDNR